MPRRAAATALSCSVRLRLAATFSSRAFALAAALAAALAPAAALAAALAAAALSAGARAAALAASLSATSFAHLRSTPRHVSNNASRLLSHRASACACACANASTSASAPAFASASAPETAAMKGGLVTTAAAADGRAAVPGTAVVAMGAVMCDV